MSTEHEAFFALLHVTLAEEFNDDLLKVKFIFFSNNLRGVFLDIDGAEVWW
jgi:hypothetical protein